jgi:metallophosphoesterase (TIGR00282 family)
MDTKGRKPSNPFLVMDNLLNGHMKASNIIVVDFHAEATSEKRALAWYLNGRVSAVIGTHTHVQTSDEEVLSGGTAYITDVGMTGPHASVIGLDKDIAIQRFLNEGEVGFKVSDEGVRLECVNLKIDEKSGKALAIERRRYLI